MKHLPAITLIIYLFSSSLYAQDNVEKIKQKYEHVFEWKIYPRYEFISDVSEENIVVVGKGKFKAYMTLDEEMLTPFEWKLLSQAYRCGVGVATNNEDGWDYLIDIQNNGKKIIDTKFLFIGDFIDGYARASIRGHKWGIIDSKGKNILDFKYQYIRMPNDLQAIIEGKSDEYIPARSWKGGGMALYGHIDIKGDFVKKPAYVMTYERANSYYRVANSFFKNDMGMLDSDLNQIIPFEYDKLFVIDDSNIKARKKDEKWGILNEKGETVIPFEFDLIGPFDSKGNAYFERSSEYGTISLSEHKVEVRGKLDREPIRYIKGNTYEGNLLTFTCGDSKYASTTYGICRFKNDKLHIEIPQEYDNIYHLDASGNFVVVQQTKRGHWYGLYNRDLKLVIDPALKEFNYIGEPNSSGYLKVGIGEIYGIAGFK